MTAWLLTWVGQGIAIAGIVAIGLRAAHRLNAATKHLAWCVALVAIACMAGSSVLRTEVAAIELQSSTPIYVPSAPEALVSLLGFVWAAVALVSAIRLVPSLHAIFVLRRRCRAFPSDIVAQLPLWREASNSGRQATLAICDAIPGATVLGFRRPCIALPSSLVDALSFDELDQVILHEYAHVQRRDDWLRLGQTLLMSILWVHPAAVFVVRAINREREMACDEWVVSRTRLPKAYARCLTRAAEVQRAMSARSTLVPALLGGRHELVGRVERLLAMQNRHVRGNVSLPGAAIAVTAIIAASAQLQVVRFAEIAGAILPSVSAPLMPVARDATVASAFALTSQTATADKPIASAFALTSQTATADKPVASAFAPASQTATADKPIATADRPNSAPITARSFSGTYALPAEISASSEPSGRWRAMATPGVEIASAARKTGVGLAGAFSRAGVSLARSF